MKTYTKEEYQKLTENVSPNSPILKNCFKAFLFGGGICTIGELIFYTYSLMGLSEDNARIGVTMTLITMSGVLTAFGVYDRIAKHAGAGSLVPITGFANSMVSPAMEFKSEGIVTGIGVKLFAIAGPVLIFGISSSVLYGLITFFFNL